jgi:hypothetical protein
MSTLLIAYDLDKPETSPEYADLLSTIKGHGAWAKVLSAGLWLVKTEETPVQVRDRLSAQLPPSARLIVIDVTGRSGAWRSLPTDVSDWIRKQI